MANASILTAFERMWEHTVIALNDKSDVSHNHNGKYEIAGAVENHNNNIEAHSDIRNSIKNLENMMQEANGASIIDVIELPTENIREDVFYRMTKGTLVRNKEYKTAIIHIVESLPEVGQPLIGINEIKNVYYVASSGKVYSYIDKTFSEAMELPIGWIDSNNEVLINIVFEAEAYKGVIYDIDDDPCDEACRILLNYDFYTYKNGWSKIPFAYENKSEINIEWDGVIGDSPMELDQFYFVKVSDEVYSLNQLSNAKIYNSYGDIIDISNCNIINESDLLKIMGPNLGIVIIYNSEAIAEENLTNGIYFSKHIDFDDLFITRLTATNEKIKKIDSKYVDLTSYAKLNDVLNAKSDNIVISTNNIRWTSVCYGNGKFVAVSDTSAACSEDGINWILTSLPYSSYNSVCYGNGKFVAVSDYNGSAYSEDGINWTETSLPSFGYNSVCYGNGKFVAVSYNDIAAYSENGINWIETSLPSFGYSSVCYGNGKFVAVNNNSSAYSEDGINWMEASLPSLITGSYSVCYGNGKFIAVGFNTSSDIVVYSENGINWTQVELPCISYWTSMCYGNGKFVVVSEDTTCVYSEDGINWIDTELPYYNDTYMNCGSVCYGNGKFVTVGESVNESDRDSGVVKNGWSAMYSEDGINWINKKFSLINEGKDVTREIAKSIQPYLNNTQSSFNEEQIKDYINEVILGGAW